MIDKIVRVGLGIIVLKNGKFLIGQRIGSHGANTWNFPGGHIEFGETFAETAAREVDEEAGVKIKNIRFAGLTNDFFANKAGGGQALRDCVYA